MALSSATILQGANKFICDITATADADVSIVVPHGLGVTPLEISIAYKVQPEGVLSGWVVRLVNATDFTAEKTTAVNSGSGAAQVRMTLAVPHSLTR